VTDTIVSIHQPAYLPWLGYLDRIARSDVFVFLDSVQFQKNSFQNRNRIRTAQGDTWLTVPVMSRGHTDSTLEHLAINNSANWQKKHLKTIEQSYRSTAGFSAVMEWLGSFYETQWEKLADLCWEMLAAHLKATGITTRVVRSSTLSGLSGTKGDLVLDIVRKMGGTRYLSGPLGLDYLEPEKFKDAGIDLDVHRFEHPVYVQTHSPFIPNMAAIDRLMCEGAPT